MKLEEDIAYLVVVVVVVVVVVRSVAITDGAPNFKRKDGILTLQCYTIS